MNHRYQGLILGYLLLLPIQSFARDVKPHQLSKEEVFSHLSKTRKFPSIAFKAMVHIKVSGGSFSQVDSGDIKFSPPDCFRMDMKVSATTQMGCGDTLWVKSPDGKVTRSINSPGEGFFGSLDPGKMLKDKDFEIKEKDAGKYVEVAFDIGDKANPMKLKIIMDTEAWLYRRATVSQPSGQTVEMGYSYMNFGGQPVFKEVNTVLGPNGFVRMSFENYERTKKMPRSHYRGF